jgi:hypothetical protein
MIEFNEVEVNEGPVRKLYTGVGVGVVVAINPNKAELEAMGFKPQQDPSYVSEDNGVRKVRMDVYLKMESGEISKMAFWIEDQPWISQAKGSRQFINAYGKTTWANDMSDLDSKEFFINEGTREAFKGEADFIDGFIRSWVRANYNNTTKTFSKILPDTKKFFNGDFSELQAVVEASKQSRGVRALFGVREVEKDGKVKYYQDVYTKHFERSTWTSLEKFAEMVNGEYTQFKSNYQNSLEFKEFVPGVITPEAEVKPTTPTNNTPVKSIF